MENGNAAIFLEFVLNLLNASRSGKVTKRGSKRLKQLKTRWLTNAYHLDGILNLHQIYQIY